MNDSRTCPFLERFVAPGRDHVYFLCRAIDEPYVPTAHDLAWLCRGEYARCSRHQIASGRTRVA